RLRSLSIATIGFAILCALPAAAQNTAYRAPRTADGKPDLNGIWQTTTTANWDLQAHGAAAGPNFNLAADFAIPPGPGVVDGNEIPYLPNLLDKRKQNLANRFKDDPEIKCYLPGVPRANYMPYPFQIIQSQKNFLVAYEYAN